MKTNRPHLPRPACTLLLPCFVLALPSSIRAAGLTTSDRIITSVSPSGNAGLGGSPWSNSFKGEAYLFRNLDTASGNVTENAKLTASDGAWGDSFGDSVSLSGNAGLVGAPSKDNVKGVAYLFRNLDTASGTITENAKLTASDSKEFDVFGGSVSLSGNTGLVGARRKDIDKGAAYLFRDLDTASGTITENAKLIASDGAQNDYFGESVSLSGNTGLVAARYHNNRKGAAYVFRNLGTASGTITENAKLTASDGVQEDYFGVSASISGNTGLVGAYGNDKGKGAAYLFRNLDTASGTVTENAKLTASDGVQGDNFGGHVSLSGNIGLVGAGKANGQTGAAYLFLNLGTASGTVTENVKLTVSSSSIFSSSTSLEGDSFLIAGAYKAYSGRVSAFTTLDEGGASRTTDGLTFVSRENWIIGQNTDGNRITLSAGDSGTVSAAGKTVFVGQNAGSDHNVLTVNGNLTANSVQVGAAGNTGNTLWVGGGGIVTTTGGVIVAVGSSVGGDGTINGNLEFSAASSLIFGGLQTLTVNGSVLFDGSFGVTNLIGLDQNTPNGIYTLIDGTSTDFAVSGLSNWGEENAYDLGGGKTAWFEQGSLKLVVLPEPGTGLLALLAGTSLILNRRPSRRS